MTQEIIGTKAKPFLKWAGGKTQLLPTLNSYLPNILFKNSPVTYIEPFVGGGAMLFFLLQKYPNIKRAVVNDVNPRLINTYTTIRDIPKELIHILKEIQEQFRSLHTEEMQKEFFLESRRRFNEETLSREENAALMIFLNRTCFNGLYRENSKCQFNVPFGRYKNPTICDAELIMADSRLLQKVEISLGDFSQIADNVTENTFIYFDPPYRPINETSCFNSYVGKSFDDGEQIRLRNFFSVLADKGCYVMLSNSDGKSANDEDDFLDSIYSDFIIERVTARRSINVDSSKRGNLTELLIRNYPDCIGNSGSLFKTI